MNGVSKSAQHFVLFWSKSKSWSYKCYPKLWKYGLVRHYSKNDKPNSSKAEAWRKAFGQTRYGNQRPRSSAGSQSKSREPVRIKNSESIGTKGHYLGTKEEVYKKTFCGVQPSPKADPCVILPHACPLKSSLLQPIDETCDKEPIKLIDGPLKEVIEEHITPKEESLEAKESKCPIVPTEEVIEPPLVQENKNGNGNKSGGGSDNSKRKWLYGLLAVAFGGAVAYYVLKSDDIVEKIKEEERNTKKKAKEKKNKAVLRLPPNSKDLPEKVQYLLIGGGTASFSAFRSIKSFDPKAQVLILAKEPEYPYMRPPLSKDIWNTDPDDSRNLMFKQWTGNVRSIYFEPDTFYMDPKDLAGSPKGGVAVAKGWEVVCIDANNNKVKLDDGTCITYEKCLLAPGSVPKQYALFNDVEEDIKDRILYYRDVDDYKRLSKAVECGGDVVIIGGGFLGSELSCSLTQRGCQVTQIIREPGILAKILPTYLSKWLTKQVRAEGVNVISDAKVTGVVRAGKTLEFSLSNGTKVTGDFCVVATGAEPDTSLAEASKLEISEKLGGYIVNSEMLAQSNLYVAGDAACFYDKRFGRRRVEHHDHAVASGRLAGENMVASGKTYDHVNMIWSELSNDIGFEAVGVLDPSFVTTGIFALEEKKAEARAAIESDASKEASKPEEHFNKGVVFYVKDDIVVGILLWNVFNGLQTARQILRQDCKYDDLNEVAKLFQIHSD